MGKNKPKLDDKAKMAVVAAAGPGGASGASGAGGANAQTAVAGAQLLSQALERYNLRMRRVCRAGAVLAAIAVALLLVGALLTHFHGGYVRTGTWRRVPGIAGIVILLFSLLVLGIGIALLVWAYHLLKNRERESEHRINLQAPNPGSLPSSAYPRQAMPGDAADGETDPLQPKTSAVATAEPSAPHADEVA